jgi:predicted RNA-binding Zn-ribbon protein involved in translation (DUF1610 family)
MRLFGGVSAQDREHLVSTLQSLGTTSMAGLSAALSWSERRTQKTLREVARWGEGAIQFDPMTRSVSLRPAASSPPSPSPAAAAPAEAPSPEPTIAPPPLPKAWGASAKCPTCQVALSPTGTGTAYYCPQCGRLSGARASAFGGPAAATSAPATPARAPPPGPRAGEPPVPPTPLAALGADRHSQELFAAWVTARPIPCPKCRTTLRHQGVAEYACPACGARVAFERSSALPAGASPGPAPPRAPESAPPALPAH